MRPAAPALDSCHSFSHQRSSGAGKRGDSRHPNSRKTRSQSSQMVTCAPGQNEAHNKALMRSAPCVPLAFGATWQRRNPAEDDGEQPPASSGRQVATWHEGFVWWENDPPSLSCREGLGSGGVSWLSGAGNKAALGWILLNISSNTAFQPNHLLIPSAT